MSKKTGLLIFTTIMLGALGASGVVYGEGLVLGIALASTHIFMLAIGIVFGIRASVGLIEKGVEIKTSTIDTDTQVGDSLATIITAVMKAATSGKALPAHKDAPPVYVDRGEPKVIEARSNQDIDNFLEGIVITESRFLND